MGSSFLVSGGIDMYYSDEQIQNAKDYDLISYLREEGYNLKKHGHEFNLNGDKSLVVFNNSTWHEFNGKMFFSNERNNSVSGGNTLDFLIYYENKSFREAMARLVGGVQSYARKPTYIKRHEQKIQQLILPNKSCDNRKAVSYLQKRGMDIDIIGRCIEQGIIYQSSYSDKNSGKTYDNVTFVGLDKTATPKYASSRSLWGQYRVDAEGSNKYYGFLLAGYDNAKTVCVFEAPIEAISLASLYKHYGLDYMKAHRLSLGCVHDGALEVFLKNHPEISQIGFRLNNDGAGYAATIKYIEKYMNNYEISYTLPILNDWNDTLKKVKGIACKDFSPHGECAKGGGSGLCLYSNPQHLIDHALVTDGNATHRMVICNGDFSSLETYINEFKQKNKSGIDIIIDCTGKGYGEKLKKQFNDLAVIEYDISKDIDIEVKKKKRNKADICR